MQYTNVLVWYVDTHIIRNIGECKIHNNLVVHILFFKWNFNRIELMFLNHKMLSN